MEMFSQEYLQQAREVYHSVLEDHKRMFGRVEASPASRNWDDEYGVTYHDDLRLKEEQSFGQPDVNWVKEGF